MKFQIDGKCKLTFSKFWENTIHPVYN